MEANINRMVDNSLLLVHVYSYFKRFLGTNERPCLRFEGSRRLKHHYWQNTVVCPLPSHPTVFVPLYCGSTPSTVVQIYSQPRDWKQCSLWSLILRPSSSCNHYLANNPKDIIESRPFYIQVDDEVAYLVNTAVVCLR